MGWVDDYRRVKKDHPDALLLWRQGDFYEAIDADAAVLAEALELRLVEMGERKIPMAGFPHTVILDRLSRLVDGGYKVAVVEPDGDQPHQVFGEPDDVPAPRPVKSGRKDAADPVAQPALF